MSDADAQPDALPDFIASVDQVAAQMTETARIVAAYYHALHRHGVGSFDSLQLCLALQAALLAGAPGADEHAEDEGGEAT